MLYEHGMAGIGKAEKALEIMRGFDDRLQIYWFEDENVEAILKENKPEVWKAYIALRDRFVDKGWGVYDASHDDEKAVNAGDAFYGDACPLMNKMRVAGKPVLWETPGVSLGVDKGNAVLSVEPGDGDEFELSEDKLLHVEDDVSLEVFIRASLAYSPEIPAGGNGRRVWQELCRKTEYISGEDA